MHSYFLIRVQTEHVSLAGDSGLIYSVTDGLSRQEKDSFRCFNGRIGSKGADFLLCVLCFFNLSFAWKQSLLLQDQLGDSKRSFSPLPL